MRTLPVRRGASMRWAGWWVAVACSIACGGGSQPGGGSGGGGGDPDAGPTDGGGTPTDGGGVMDCGGLMPPAPGAAVTFDVASSGACGATNIDGAGITRSEEHTSELQS